MEDEMRVDGDGDGAGAGAERCSGGGREVACGRPEGAQVAVAGPSSLSVGVAGARTRTAAPRSGATPADASPSRSSVLRFVAHQRRSLPLHATRADKTGGGPGRTTYPDSRLPRIRKRISSALLDAFRWRWRRRRRRPVHALAGEESGGSDRTGEAARLVPIPTRTATLVAWIVEAGRIC
ncbi:hypothetical protein ZWY2020_012399 [Hordeum vulgare]|nr:hypothetical protein ZWY2020_012399 [Hordeum vulgare]